MWPERGNLFLFTRKMSSQHAVIKTSVFGTHLMQPEYAANIYTCTVFTSSRGLIKYTVTLAFALADSVNKPVVDVVHSLLTTDI